ncbi:MAG: L-carnitine dehydratase/bile acid-inducible protein F [Synergistales bacterium 53_16]|jgi:CoA:oxalate CoA-transferase|nr:MAG: L-carnitine dehydratase/bile acid-inducible protein F [Synergistales bacterium 53_16]MDN5335446.1 CoA:oxalate CoA-transferase [Synergistales bacterium]HAG23050.1 carnitine dehydratase [Synergistaceae bacterium]
MKALEGIKILDFTRVLAGPFCTMMLADLGAEVIKVERPGAGDDSRHFGPFVGEESAYFMSINRNKKSITVNLKEPAAVEIIKRMIPKMDVVVENFRPGVMEKLGLGYEVLKELNPGLIYASSSGFGHTGPYSQLPAYDLILQGMGGIMSITGPDSEHPTKVGSSIADIFAGTFCAIGILAALHHREKTGEGQEVDVSMLDSQVAILENAVARYFVTGESPVPIGNRHPSIAPFATFHTTDGFINIAVGNDAIWKRFCELVGRPELVEDARFSTNGARNENWQELEPILKEIMSKDSTEGWIERLRKAAVPCGPINNIEQVVNDPQVRHRQMIVEVEHPVAGKFKMPGCPLKLSATPAEEFSPAPVLGADLESVLVEYAGMTPEEIEDLRKRGIA